MANFTGLMTINGTDAWQYKAFLCEMSKEANFNLGELTKRPGMKAYTSVSFREENGERLPEELPSPCYEPIDRTLQVCITGNDRTACVANHNTFMNILKGGWLELSISGFGTHKVYYREVTSVAWFMDDHACACILKIKFREPVPGDFE